MGKINATSLENNLLLSNDTEAENTGPVDRINGQKLFSCRRRRWSDDS